MLEIGNGAMTETEYRTHMSLWSILAAPLLAGNDLAHMKPEILAILTNAEVIAVDQDKDGKQGKRVWQSGEQEAWARPLAGGDQAIAVFNRAAGAADVTLKWSDVGLKRTPSKVRDLWAHSEVRVDGPEFAVSVPGHGVMLLRVK